MRALVLSRGRNFGRDELLVLLKEALRQEDRWQWDFNNVFDIIRSTGVCDKELNELFFSRGLQLGDDDGSGDVCEGGDDAAPMLNTRLAIRYMNFVTHINGPIRNAAFEREVLDRCSRLASADDCPFVGKFAACFAFVLSYGGAVPPATITDRFFRLVDNMDPMALALVARGVASRWRFQASVQGRGSRDEEEDAELRSKVSVAVVKRAKQLLTLTVRLGPVQDVFDHSNLPFLGGRLPDAVHAAQVGY